MKLNLEEQEETIEPVEKTDLIYGIDDRPPFKEALFAALQHLLAIFVAIITPPLIIAGALKLDLETTGFLVSMALFASGVSTFIQCRRIGPVGAKLLCIQGTSFSFIGPIITAGLAGGCLDLSTIRKLTDLGIKFYVQKKTNYKTDKLPVQMDYLDDIDIAEFKEIPTYKRMCICILKNDHVCKYMGFALTKKEKLRRDRVMQKYKNIIK